MKKKSPEKVIEYEILQLLKSRGVFCWKNDRQGTFDPTKRVFRANKNPHKIKGVSDILGIFFGKFLAIEVKSKTGRVSPEQSEFLSNVNKNGGIAFVARSSKDVEDYLSKVITGLSK